MPTFHTNCTVPSGNFNFVTAPNTRGTLGILWNCIGTLVLCTWTVLHLNVPEQWTPQNKIQGFRRRLERFGTKLKWMTITLFAPEFILGKAYSDNCSARRHFVEGEPIAKEDGVAWTVAHAFLANIGGIGIVFNSQLEFKGESIETLDSALPLAGPTSTVNLQSQQQRFQGASPGETQLHHNSNAETPSANSSRTDRVPQDPSHTGTQQYELEPVESPAQESHSATPSPVSASLAAEVVPECTKGANPQRECAVESIEETSLETTQSPAQVLEERLCPSPIPTCTMKPEQLYRKDQLKGLNLSLGLIPDHLRARKIDQTFGLHTFFQSQRVDPGAMEPRLWTRNAVNADLVSAAIDNLQLDIFPTTWEKRRLLDRYIPWYANLGALQGNVWIVDACQLLLARKMGIIDRLPSLSEDEVDDRNKGDFLVKGLAVAQVIWLFVQLVARGARGLAPSQLEIVVLAFAACTFATYILLWNKPQDVRTPTYVYARRYPSTQELSRLAISGPDPWPYYRKACRMPNNALHCDGGFFSKMVLGSLFGAMIFRVLHCAAWNFHFPTVIERFLWRISAVTTVVIPPTMVAFVMLVNGFLMWKARNNGTFAAGRDPTTLINWVGLAATVIYVVVRLYITVETFRSLWFLEPEAYMNTWATNIPHID
ncbi:uncharacterized protein PV07_10384 [Cladophialophora immunda]|uniref:Uncharacterized protein n=1 Tax=Cladophialophora immunda TaxID=569365 RepID=A0A0D2AIF9_9EURO|nr:uncharacterized protein PV07_10384 [Cladophialophora immunda]KIW24682.1 hypothetical protein PV07_10384 [Cladophialophora immunda]